MAGQLYTQRHQNNDRCKLRYTTDPMFAMALEQSTDCPLLPVKKTQTSHFSFSLIWWVWLWYSLRLFLSPYRTVHCFVLATTTHTQTYTTYDDHARTYRRNTRAPHGRPSHSTYEFVKLSRRLRKLSTAHAWLRLWREEEHKTALALEAVWNLNVCHAPKRLW